LVCYGCVCMDEVYVGPDYTAVLCYIEAWNLPWITIPFLSSIVRISCTNCAKMRGFHRIPVLGLPVVGWTVALVHCLCHQSKVARRFLRGCWSACLGP
jgi:hypothetical protein